MTWNQQEIEDGFRGAGRGDMPGFAIKGEWNIEDHRAVEKVLDDLFDFNFFEQLKAGLNRESLADLINIYVTSQMMLNGEEHELYLEMDNLMRAAAATGRIQEKFDEWFDRYKSSLEADEDQTLDGAESFLSGLLDVLPFLTEGQQDKLLEYYSQVTGLPKGKRWITRIPVSDRDEALLKKLGKGALNEADMEEIMERLPKYSPLCATRGLFGHLLTQSVKSKHWSKRSVWAFMITNYDDMEEKTFPRSKEILRLVARGEYDAYLKTIIYIALNEGYKELFEAASERTERIYNGVRLGKEGFGMIVINAHSRFELACALYAIGEKDAKKAGLLASLV